MIFTTELAQSGGHENWEAIVLMVKHISEGMMLHLPNFWKIAKNFLDGKYKRVCNTAIQGFLFLK